jgi:8-oxo-dGTP pyrophosphatase MutT (NUDIX family)
MAKQQGTTEFLLMKHPNRWDLPKGHCEAGESFEETALRETEEETGISRHAIELDHRFQFALTYPVTYKKTGDQVFEKQVHYFLGYLQAKPPLALTEHESAEWFRWNPPHQIQAQTIDPLLAAVAAYLSTSKT